MEKEAVRIIGDAGFKGKPDSDGVVEIGYGVLPADQGGGYATEAVGVIIARTFGSDEVERVIAERKADNIPSIRVLEKLKMSRLQVEKDMLKWELVKTLTVKSPALVSCTKNSGTFSGIFSLLAIFSLTSDAYVHLWEDKHAALMTIKGIMAPGNPRFRERGHKRNLVLRGFMFRM